MHVTQFLRSVEVTKNVSKVSSIKIVRDFLIITQRKLAKDNNIIVDGRDIGTTVFPNADYKFYIDADIEIRAKRRFDETDIISDNQDYKSILEMMKERDSYDRNRMHSPLNMAEDAIFIDTTDLSLNEQVGRIISIIKQSKE
jgi:cytidylate kinase